MIVIGIDPGTATTGYGVVEKKIRGSTTALDWGTITTQKNLPAEIRLKILGQDLNKLMRKYKPQLAVVESIYFEKNLKTAMKVAEARGVVLLTLAQAGVRIHELTPLQVKSQITGFGKAKKPQIQYMVKTLLKLSTLPKPDDAADALALALCSPTLHDR
jgi:crossover junction endodeoxyribonuclease RuvC